MITYRTTSELRKSKDEKTVAIINSAALDRHGTIIDPDGVNLSNYKQNPVFLINHDYNMLAGNGADIRSQDGKLIAEVPDEAWDKEDPDVMKYYRKVKNGKMRMTSIGFNYDYDDVEEEERIINGETKTVPVIRKSELLEFSFVTVGSNPEALVLQRQFASEGIDLIKNLETEIKQMKNRFNAMADRDWLRALIEEQFESYLPTIRTKEPEKEPEADKSVDRKALIEKEAQRIITDIKRQRGQQ